MGARLLHLAIGAAARELRREARRGARWADAHLVGKNASRAEVVIDSSYGFDEARQPERGASSAPPTVIVVEVA